MSEQKIWRLKTLKGVYVLVIQLSKNAEIRVGALGKLPLNKGTHLYVGSAQNGLEKRVERHFIREKRRFWHIDYLLENPATRIVTVFYKKAPKTSECVIAEAIGKRGEAVAGFGCSDCRCRSHLFRIDDYAFLRGFMNESQ
ncbi:GIY-YIG nuclease family protein [Candidatus Bathyarchaeota archaeon]|nr:GIY-YIG nuclease family protein [Candidatus Bathyarchaeota archaeon]